MGRLGWITGVYIIQSLIKTGRIYVGSASTIKGRWSIHKQQLRKGKHHSLKLQRHYNKYGEKDLIFEVLECGDYICKEHLLAREQGWCDHFKYPNTDIPYFNNCKIAGSPLGVKRSEEFCKKLGERSRGNTYLRGKHFLKSKEATEKMVKTLLIFYQTEEGKLCAKKRGEKMRGIKKPFGMGEKLSKAISGVNHHQFGKPLKPETKKLLSIARTGRTQSEETKLKRITTITNTKRGKVILCILDSLLNYKNNGQAEPV